MRTVHLTQDDDCKCKDTWTYNGEDYRECDSRISRINTPWCYIEGNLSSCPDAEDGTHPWRYCNVSENTPSDPCWMGEWKSFQTVDGVSNTCTCENDSIVEEFVGAGPQCYKKRTLKCPACKTFGGETGYGSKGVTGEIEQVEDDLKCVGSWKYFPTYNGEPNVCQCGVESITKEFIGDLVQCYEAREEKCPTRTDCIPCNGDWYFKDGACDHSCGKSYFTEHYVITPGNDGKDCLLDHFHGEERTKYCSNNDEKPECYPCSGKWIDTSTEECTQICGEKTYTTEYIVTPGTDNSECLLKSIAKQEKECPNNETNPVCYPCTGEWKKMDVDCNHPCKKQSYTETFEITPGTDGSTCNLEEKTRAVQCENNDSKPECRDCSENTTRTGSECAHACGHEFYTMATTVIPSTNGTECTLEEKTETLPCENNVDCQSCTGEWKIQGECNQPCGTKEMIQKYSITNKGNDGSICAFEDGATEPYLCPKLTECRPCMGEYRPKEGEHCKHQCDTTDQPKQITETFIITDDGNTGTCNLKAENPDRNVPCEKKPRCLPCIGSWVETKSCTQPCGDEKKTFTYKVTQEPTDGTECEFSNGGQRQEDCKHPQCVSCEGEWKTQGECDQPCGTKELISKYKVITKGNDGSACDFDDGAEEPFLCPEKLACEECAGEYQPKDGENCEHACDVGNQPKKIMETFIITNPGTSGICNLKKANPDRQVDCPSKPECTACVGRWEETLSCMQSCGSENKTLTWVVDKEPTDGSTCPFEKGEKRTEACNNPSCVSCKGEWQIDGQCDHSCGAKTLAKTYKVTEKGNDGSSCDFPHDTKDEYRCPDKPECKECEGEYKAKPGESCDRICGEKTITETFTITKEGTTGRCDLKSKNPDRDFQCPSKPECSPCVGRWVESECQQTCGPETKTSTWIVDKAPTDGSTCEFTNGFTKEEDCGNTPCTMCEGDWTINGKCDQICGTKELTRTYRITNKGNTGQCPFDDGKMESYACPEVTACTECEGNYRPREGEKCNNTCGSKQITETFVITGDGTTGRCTLKEENPDRKVDCPSQPDCTSCIGHWEETECQQTCGSEQKTLTWIVDQEPTDGSRCEFANGFSKQESCNHPACKSCQGEWKLKGKCDQECGSKTLTQIYEIINRGNDGSECEYKEGAEQTYTCEDKPPCASCQGEWVTNANSKDGTCDDFECGTKTIADGLIFEVKNLSKIDPTICDIAPGTTKNLECPVKESCRPCKGNWIVTNKCDETRECGYQKRREMFEIQDYGLGPESCENQNVEFERESDCSFKPECRPCIGEWSITAKCDNDRECGHDTGKRTYRILDEGLPMGDKNEKPCQYENMYSETFDCEKKPPCPTKICANIDIEQQLCLEMGGFFDSYCIIQVDTENECKQLEKDGFVFHKEEDIVEKLWQKSIKQEPLVCKLINPIPGDPRFQQWCEEKAEELPMEFSNDTCIISTEVADNEDNCYSIAEEFVYIRNDEGYLFEWS
jgi:hypothetical protein